MTNTDLRRADAAKNDEFYTQFNDIQNEVNAYLEYNPDVFRGMTVLCPCDDPEWSNFTKFFAAKFDDLGLKKLISTSYAYNSRNPKPNFDWQPTLFELESPEYDAAKSPKNGKIFTLTDQEDPPHDIDKLKWRYLEGDGDFRSDEVKKLYDEADIIVTNPPFSLFREFVAWITQDESKKFLIIGNINALSYKEIFPLIKENKIWLGHSIHSGDREFGVPETYPLTAASSRIDENGKKFIRVKGVRWFTNLDHGRRHEKIKSQIFKTQRNKIIWI